MINTSTHQQKNLSNGIPGIDFKLLALALDASVSGIILTDNKLPDNPIIYCNRSFEKMSGYTRAEIIGHNCRFLQREDRHQQARSILKQSIRDGRECVIEIRNYRKNGDLFWNELCLSPVKDEQGNVTHFIGIQNDISEKKKAEQDLRLQQQLMEKRIEERTRMLKESESYLASIIQTVRESLLVLDPHFTVLTANDHFLKTFKVSAEETVGKHLYQLGNKQWNIPALRKLLVSILPTNNPVEDFEVEHDFPHIGKKLMLLNAYRVELEGKYKDQILLAIEDITERKEIERRKDDFLSIASHELKTPLTTIKGYIQLMEKMMPDQADETFREIVQKTILYTNRLNNLISELLDVSKIQSGKIELHKAAFDFDRVVHESVEAIQASCSDQTIIIGGKTGIVYNGDESHIIQVLNNLISNALKYAPGSTEVQVHLSLVGDYLKFSVTDYGIGITAADQKKIFERFFRAGEIQEKFPGMGIGLYISEQIIKNHGGTLWVESEKGKGSTFSFTLPLKDEHCHA